MKSMDTYYHADIEKITRENTAFRKVLYTVHSSMQLVVMSLKPEQEIGMEVHPKITQFIRIEEGYGVAVLINDPNSPKPQEQLLHAGSVLIIPRGVWHNVINASKTLPLKLYTVYCPPEHSTCVDKRKECQRLQQQGVMDLICLPCDPKTGMYLPEPYCHPLSDKCVVPDPMYASENKQN